LKACGHDAIAIRVQVVILAVGTDSNVIELRFFGGLSVEETADVLDVSPQTVMRDWKLARAWLTRELQK
jgi:DNA-directed RNA polymerase specialized sigma subunit